ncbi:MAG: 4-aminobutyrate aminotransferase / (S)-3-amino-2-methylpropionate transaminase / 5-aminovalerate [Acidobacteriota bacterium]|nr:4-aminobutyrate aminotransferase / (S)-3-amino-2-methylpropionate transaminase / 5-aminovalerate [Acidobacteriota bacterium]
MTPPGPRSRELSRRIAEVEAPGINTLTSAPGAVSLFWDEAEGAHVRDVDGNLYIDLTSGFGVAAVGHRHPRVVEAVRAQAGRLLHGLGDVHGHPLRVELAERLVKLAPVDDPQVFFSISGSEAVEIALKTAIAATGRSGIVAFEPSYHGMTMGSLAVTSRPGFREPFAAHLHGHVRRLPYGSPVKLENEAAVLVEPIVGREGVILPPPGWLAELARLCRETGALLVADEIFTGFGRTGRLFAVQHEGVRPDLLCCGKALGGGLPIAAVLGRRSLFRCWETEGEALHTATFVANPVACAAALAVLDVIEEEDLAARAARMGEWVANRLSKWPGVAVRGRGLLWGIELPSAEIAKRWTVAALARGIILLAGGPEGRVAQIVPPLNIPEELLETALEILEETLG